MTPLAVRMRWVGSRQPRRPWLAQIASDDGATVETLPGEHETEALALKAGTREIYRRIRARHGAVD